MEEYLFGGISSVWTPAGISGKIPAYITESSYATIFGGITAGISGWILDEISGLNHVRISIRIPRAITVQISDGLKK